MLNQGGITRVNGFNVEQILASTSLQYSLPVMVDGTGVTAKDGKKIIKAGTPLAGDITNRGTAFKVAKDGTATVLLLHDVDVTSGNANASALIFGFVDLARVSTEVKAMITPEVKAALNKITFIA